MTKNDSVLLAALLLGISQTACWAQSADNTQINQRDRVKGTMTADEQGQSKEDLALTQAIRQDIVNDQSLSLYGHNIKIITNHGMVTIKGPVDSQQEKQAIESLALNRAGTNNLHNELEVVSK